MSDAAGRLAQGIPIAIAVGVGDAWLCARDYRDDAAGRPPADPDAFYRAALIGVGAASVVSRRHAAVGRPLLLCGLGLAARDIALLLVRDRSIAEDE